MWDKFKNEDFAKKVFKKIIIIILIAIIALLTLDVLTTNKDGRRQIVDPNGGTEYIEGATAKTSEEARLKGILEDINMVGSVQVMITYQSNSDEIDSVETSVFDSSGNSTNDTKVEGVVITAQGASNVVVKNDIISAVKALYGIPTTRIMVYEKEGGKK